MVITRDDYLSLIHGYTIFNLYSTVHRFDHFPPAGYQSNTHNTDMKKIIYDFNHSEISRLQRVREYKKNCIVSSGVYYKNDRNKNKVRIGVNSFIVTHMGL